MFLLTQILIFIKTLEMSLFFIFMNVLGQVSVQRAMLEVNPYRSKFKESVDGYIEEGIIRRELADNFCYYNDDYDKISGKFQSSKTYAGFPLHRENGENGEK